ncbi:MAG TPA: hypothetical protein VNF71_10775 [Acidimicrobiales bacterium]|nr:hypothetical protein [Acidimicrobiales bacterium]
MPATSRHRHAMLVAVVLLCAAGTAALILLRGNPPEHRSAAPRRPEPTVSAPARPPPPPPARSQAAVGFTTLNVSASGGDFAVQVFYPAARPGAAASVSGAGAPYPLIVFSPGFDIDPAAYTTLVGAWTQAGFVVAVPHYPFTAPGDPGGLYEADIVNHPADLRSVIDEILALSASRTGLLSGAVDPTRIGAAGHSDGGDVTDAVVANSCCLDIRVKAAAMFAGAELTSFSGTYTGISVPALVVQGGADRVNLPACSQQIYDSARAARFYLDLPGAGHHAPYLQNGVSPSPAGTTYQRTVDRVSVLFWQGYLRGDTAARSGLAALSSSAPPGATLFAGSPVTQDGVCPGAPQ